MRLEFKPSDVICSVAIGKGFELPSTLRGYGRSRPIHGVVRRSRDCRLDHGFPALHFHVPHAGAAVGRPGHLVVVPRALQAAAGTIHDRRWRGVSIGHGSAHIGLRRINVVRRPPIRARAIIVHDCVDIVGLDTRWGRVSGLLGVVWLGLSRRPRCGSP